MSDQTLRFVGQHFTHEPKPMRAAKATRDVLPFPPGGVFGLHSQPAHHPDTLDDVEHLERAIDAMQRKLDELAHQLDEDEHSYRIMFDDWDTDPPQAA